MPALSTTARTAPPAMTPVPQNVVKATMEGLLRLRQEKEVRRLRGLAEVTEETEDSGEETADA